MGSLLTYNGGSTRSSLQRQNLRAVDPGYNIDRTWRALAGNSLVFERVLAILPPKINMYKKKKATAAEAGALRSGELTLRRAARNIMQRERPRQPQIMVHRRPILSNARAGSRFPIGNILLGPG